jgi:hypothetical protein
LGLRNQVIRAFAIPGVARFAVGRDIVDSLQLPDYRWPSLSARSASPLPDAFPAADETRRPDRPACRCGFDDRRGKAKRPGFPGRLVSANTC